MLSPSATDVTVKGIVVHVHIRWCRTTGKVIEQRQLKHFRRISFPWSFWLRLTTFLATVFPHLATLHLDTIEMGDQQITLVLSSTHRMARCPDCHARSRWVHSHFVRTLSDVPVATFAVRLRLRARRFCCRTAACRRRTFRERLPTVAPIYQRRTPLRRRQLECVGFVLGGQAGHRLLQELGLGNRGISRNSVLRLVRQAVLPTVPIPRVLGVDDFSWRRGVRYHAPHNLATHGHESRGGWDQVRPETPLGSVRGQSPPASPEPAR